MLGRVVNRLVGSTQRERMEKATTSNESSAGSPSYEKKEDGDVEVDNSKCVLMNIASIYGDRLMSDVLLLVNDVEYPAHRLLLCASSNVFQAMLMGEDWTESKTRQVILQESHRCAKIFGQFLKYFYTGLIRINHTNIMPILILADKYNVKDLVTLCVKYMCEHIPHAAAHNQLITWFQYSLSLGHYMVAQGCENFIKWNFESIASTSDFGNLKLGVLVRLLKQNDLVVQNEYKVFDCAARWLNTQYQLLEDGWQSNPTIVQQIESVVHQVMENVRFPMMTPHELASLLMCPLIEMHKDFFLKKMAFGMSYHSSTINCRRHFCSYAEPTDRIPDVAESDSSDGKLMFTPRLYTTEDWCTPLLVENFSLMAPYHIRTLVLSSHTKFSDYREDSTCDWIVEVFPKGVWFRKFFLIVWQGSVEVPESVLKTVRVSVTCKNPPGDGHNLRVKIGLLVWGMQDGVEHVRSVITCNHRFTEEDRVLNMDEVIAFEELNPGIKYTDVMAFESPKPSPFLVGENRDVLKIQVVIEPLSDDCCIDNKVVNLESFMKNNKDAMITE